MEIKTSIRDLISTYTTLPEEVDIKDSLEIALELEDELEETEMLNILLSKLECSKNKKENQTVTTNFKLPDLPLPSVSGKYDEFQNFKTQFVSIIGNNKNLCYFKGCRQKT